jgi:hypothetical protein
MALKFVPVSTVKKVVAVQVPGDFGKTTPADFEAEYKRLTVTQARDLIKQIQEQTANEEEVLRENVVNVKGIKDTDGKDIPFNSELLAQLLDEGYIRGPLLAGFLDVNYGLDKLRQKN